MNGQRLYLPKTGCVSLKNLIERDGLSDGKTEAMMSEREGPTGASRLKTEPQERPTSSSRLGLFCPDCNALALLSRRFRDEIGRMPVTNPE